MFPYTATQESQHKELSPKKLASNPRDQPFARHTFWVAPGRGQCKTDNLERCRVLHNPGFHPAYLWLSVHKASFLQKVWSMCCLHVVTLSINLTSDTGLAIYQKPVRFHTASASAVSSFLNSQPRATVVWGGTGAEVSQCESKHVPGTAPQGVGALWWSGRKSPSVGPVKGN